MSALTDVADTLRKVRDRISKGAVTGTDLEALDDAITQLHDHDCEGGGQPGGCPSISPDGRYRCTSGAGHIDRHVARLGPGSYLRWSDEEAAR